MRHALSLLFIAGLIEVGAHSFFREVASINLPQAPSALVYDASGERLIAAGGRDGCEYLIAASPPGWKPVRLSGCASPSFVAAAAIGDCLYLSDTMAGTLVRRMADEGKLDRLYLGHFPGRMAFTPAGDLAVVLIGCDWHPGRYDSGSALAVVPLEPFDRERIRFCPLPEARYGEARALCLSADARTAYVAASPADYGAVTLVAVDLDTVAVRRAHTLIADRGWVSPDGLILSKADEPIVAIDGPGPTTLVHCSGDLVEKKRLVLEGGPTSMARSPDRGYAVIAGRGAGSLRRLDLTSIELGPSSVSPVDCPRALAFDHDGSRLFVAGSYASRVAVMEPSESRPVPPQATDAGSRHERILYQSTAADHRMLWALRPDGSDRRAIMRMPVQSHALWLSPDGTRIAYQHVFDTVPDLCVYDIVSGTHARLTTMLRDFGPLSRGVASPEWLPHGRALVFETGSGLYETSLLVVSASGGAVHPLLDNYDDRDMQPEPHPWDPDRILFLFDSGNWTFNREIRLFDRHTSAQWSILPSNGRAHEALVWHADDATIYWTQTGTEFNSSSTLWSMTSAGDRRRQVVPVATEFGSGRRCVAVAPSGDQLLCNVYTSANSDVCIIDPSQGTIRALVDTPGNKQAVDWALMVLPPDGKVSVAGSVSQ